MIIVLDANELFSAVISRSKTLDLLFNPRLELIAPQFILEEFQKYFEKISKKSGLTRTEVITWLVLISEKIKFYPIAEYESFMSNAEEISPDPNDSDYFALALKMNCSIWSEDKKLKGQDKVKVLSTKDLIELLER